MKTKPQLSFWQIWNMSFGFLGIQFGFALQNANVSRIFETLGAPISIIPILWAAAPITGLVVQPIIGYWSDKTWGRWGRRRPFFFVGALLASIALFLMPNSPVLWVAVGMLWIMDASINVSMEPFRAFVGDMLPDSQRTFGFAMQSFFIGIGAVVASALPWMMTNWFNISNVAPEGAIPDSVKFSFYVGGAVFFLAVLFTVLTTKEYSPQELEEFDNAEAKDAATNSTTSDLSNGTVAFLKKASLFLAVGLIFTLLIFVLSLEKELLVLSGGFVVFGILLFYSHSAQRKGMASGVVEVMGDLFTMPKTMKQLAVVQFFSWFALFAMWIYSTAGITSHTYNMKIDAGLYQDLQYATLELGITEGETNRYLEITKEMELLSQHFSQNQSDATVGVSFANYFLEESRAGFLQESTLLKLQYIDSEYNKGADWVGVLFAGYNGFAAILAFLLPVLARFTSRKVAHMIALLCGGLGLISIYFISNPNVLLVSMVGVGFAWASILSVPYAILTKSLPSNKMGVYMGIFNFFIVIPQILAASILGFLVTHLFDGQPIYALLLGGGTLILAGLLTLRVED